MLLVLSYAAMPIVSSGEITRILAMGQVGPKDCPIHSWFSAVPDIDYTLVITKQDIATLTEREMHRWIRLYFPRNRRQLVEDYDQYVLVDSWLTGWGSSRVLTAQQVSDMKWSIGEHGMPVFETGIWSSKTPMVDGLLASEIEEYLPVDLTGPRQMDSKYVYKVKVNRDEKLPPVLKAFLSLGIERFQGQWIGQLYPKEGTTVWATVYDTNMPSPPPGGWPWLVSWRVGKRNAIFWVAADDLEVKWWWGLYNPPTENPYGIDVLCNIIYYSVGKKLPENALMVHNLRRRFLEFNSRKALATSVIEFAEKFKANTGRVWSEMADVEQAVDEARQAYLDHRFEDCAAHIEEAEKRIAEIARDAIRLKDAALMWVFTIEWLAVFAASMISGSILWTVMVRRGLYREVSHTTYRSL